MPRIIHTLDVAGLLAHGVALIKLITSELENTKTQRPYLIAETESVFIATSV